ncbi:hypothetical protein DFH07DRAFT_745859, partial [Mycena maculata]
IDGSTNPFMHLDREPEFIILRCLHLSTNNYGELIMFLLRCNMVSKNIGFGQVAKYMMLRIT